jgi:choline-sulfatase
VSARAPNLLLILTDQQRADALGVVSAWMKTPTLDRLAREGVVFARCITQSPACTPARVALMTGLYPHNTGVWHGRRFTLPGGARTWVRAIRDAGYLTSMIGKTHLHPQEGDIRDRLELVQSWGFERVHETAGPRASAVSRSHMTDEWQRLGLLDAFVADLEQRSGENRDLVRPSPLGLEHHYDAYVGRVAVEEIRSYDRDRPWFCWVGFGGPHEPWDAPEPYASLYEPDAAPASLPPAESVSSTRPLGLLDERVAGDSSRIARLGVAGLAAIRANYAGKVSLIDHWVGEILRSVEERGELERTFVVFASDHGEMSGDHGLLHKSCFLQGAVTVPLIIRPPASECPARVVDDPVELIDIGPTLAEAAGAPITYAQWGRSLLGLVEGGSGPVRELAVSEERGEVVAVGGRWKVALNNAGEAYLCTDLERDPDELRNLAGTSEAREVERTYRERLLAFMLRTQLVDEWH